MQAPDAILIPSLITAELWRRFLRSLRSSRFYKWRFAGWVPEKLAMAPQDLRPANKNLAVEFYNGHFNFCGVTTSTRGNSPFEIDAPTQEWFDELHSFRWLRHLRADGSDLITANANALLNDWIVLWGDRIKSDAWRSDIIAARLIAWLSHSPLFVKESNLASYQRFLKSLTKQARYLRHNVHNVRDGYPRLHVTIALAFVALCLDGREKTVRQATKDLNREIERQILPDGGHLSRSPQMLVDILTDLLPLRQAYKKRGEAPSATLLSAIDRMMSAISFYQHSNGQLAQFNGTGVTHTDQLETVLRYADFSGRPLESSPQSGFERLNFGKTVVLIDTGIPHSRATAQNAMAGTLSFELSSGKTRFIANCGSPEYNLADYIPYARATAAHSTAVIEDTSSSRFATESKLYSYLPSPYLRGPSKVQVHRETKDGFVVLKSNHNGYVKPFNIMHHRELHLSEDGKILNGIDRFTSSDSNRQESKSVSIRFHLPPTVSASHLTSGHSILIADSANSSEAWTLTCIDAPLEMQESIQFSGPGQPRKSQQIVIEGNTDQGEIRWTMTRGTKQTIRRSKTSSKKLPISDLLDPLENKLENEQKE